MANAWVGDFHKGDSPAANRSPDSKSGSKDQMLNIGLTVSPSIALDDQHQHGLSPARLSGGNWQGGMAMVNNGLG